MSDQSASVEPAAVAEDATGRDPGIDLAAAEEAVVPDGEEAGKAAAPDLDREGDIAADYLEGFLDIADLDGDIDIDVEGDRASLAIVGDGLGRLIGERGATLEALQELTRLAVTRQTGQRSRLMLDIGGYRAGRRSELADMGRRTAEQVRSSGEAVTLAAMTAFERKVVHDAVATIDGVRSESEGVDPDRHVVVHPA